MATDHVLVAGTGGVGSVIGGFLRRAGLAVTLLGRQPHVEAIARSGLHIDGLWGAHHVDGFHVATSAATLPQTFTVILVAVKAYDTRSMATAVAPFLAADGVMISLQNGLGNVEAIEAIVGPERALGARVIFGSTVPEPGRAHVTAFADPTTIGARHPGRYPECDAAARKWASIIDAAGVPATYTEQLETLLWAKIFYNAALNPLSALLDLHYGALAERPDCRAIMDAAIDEAAAVAAATGADLPWPTAGTYREEFYNRLVPVTYQHRSSMLQDLERGRRTEVDAINGEVWHRGQAHDIKTPVNEMLTRLMHLAVDTRKTTR